MYFPFSEPFSQAAADLISISHDMRTMSSLPDIEAYNTAEKLRLESEEIIKDVPGSSIMMVIQPISSTAIRAAESTGGSPTGLKAQPHQCMCPQMLNLIDGSYANQVQGSLYLLTGPTPKMKRRY